MCQILLECDPLILRNKQNSCMCMYVYVFRKTKIFMLKQTYHGISFSIILCFKFGVDWDIFRIFNRYIHKKTSSITIKMSRDTQPKKKLFSFSNTQRVPPHSQHTPYNLKNITNFSCRMLKIIHFQGICLVSFTLRIA